MKPRHRHSWLRIAGKAGEFECLCGAVATLTDAGLRWRLPKRNITHNAKGVR
jgi:hypothetical protein